MGGEQQHPAAVESFVAEAAARGMRGPVRIVEHDSHGWQVLVHNGDPLLLDEYGDLWWVRLTHAGEARAIRPCWPEEKRRFHPRIARALASLRSGAASSHQEGPAHARRSRAALL